jgi:hypothetical protein
MLILVVTVATCSDFVMHDDGGYHLLPVELLPMNSLKPILQYQFSLLLIPVEDERLPVLTR